MRHALLLPSLLLIGCASDPTAGPAGPQGPPGPGGKMGDKGETGNAGLMGATGSMGAMGTNGQSVVAMSLSPGDLNCPTGGSQFTAGLTTTYACNGALGLKGDKGDKGDLGNPGPNVVNGTTQFTNNAIPATAINRNGLNADQLDGRHAVGGTNDSSTDLLAYIEKRVCEAKGGFWSDTSGCLPFMQQTALAVTSADRYAECTKFGPEYAPCNVYQALALSQAFPIPQRQYYWLSPGGTATQNGTGIIARIANIPSPLCAAGSSVAYFHSWDNDHVDSPECRADAEAWRVLCCRRNFN